MTEKAFKPVPGNGNLEVALPGIYRNRDGSECTLTYDKQGMVVKLYGQTISICPEKLALIAHFEIKLNGDMVQRYHDFEFVKTTAALAITTCGFVPILASPIEMHPGFRLCPLFPRYCISKTGRVLDTKNGRVKNLMGSKGDTYLSVDVYDPDRSERRTVGHHRMVASAWVENPSPAFKTVVNHIDGDKQNNLPPNLEWVTVRENNLHAFNAGLRGDGIACRVRDIRTGEIHEFATIAQASQFMGVPGMRTTSMTRVRPEKLVAQFFEVRLENDDRPWHYAGLSEPLRADRYVYTIKTEQGETEVYSGTREVVKKYGVWNCNNASGVIARFKEMYPQHEITVEDRYDTRPLECMVIETRKVFERPTIAEMAKATGVSKAIIRELVASGKQYMVEGLVFRRKTDEPWPDSFIQAPTASKCILMRHKETLESVTFPSLRKAAEHFNVDRSVIKLRLKTEGDYQGWMFTTT